MLIIKMLLLFAIFSTSILIGKLKANQYKQRVKDLKEMKNGLSIFKTKIRYTYEPIPEVFNEISNNLVGNIGKIFEIASINMKTMSAGQAWIKALYGVNHSFNKEDVNVIEGLNKLLGKTDLEGQINEIDLTDHFLEQQIEKADQERKKNEKLCQTLGTVIGLAVVIILI